MDAYDEIVRRIPVIVSIPHRNDLCCVTCEISLTEIRDSSAKSNFHWQTMKCRLLIFQLCEVIAAPAPIVNKPFPFLSQCKHEEEPMYINVVCTKEYFATGVLQSHFEQYKLAYSSPQPVTIETYKSCLSYTIQCKIAPEWIRIGKNLIRDINFDDATNFLDAIQLNISIEGDCRAEKTRFDLLARTTNVPFLNLEDFCFPPQLLAEFNADLKGRIDLIQPYYSQFSRWIHVLPSMKRGKIVSVSKEMSKDCPFKDYEQLRRHWRNMYGYKLPKTPENILYYEVCFPVPSRTNTRFTYPNCCLIVKPLEFRTHINPNNVVTKFIQNVLHYVPKICDKKLEISKLLSAPTTPTTVKTPGLNVKSVERVSLSRHMFTMMGNTPTCVEATPKMEFSTKFSNPLLKADVAEKPRLTPRLSVIQQVHSASTLFTVNCNKIEEKNLAKSSISTQSPEERNISSYFTERKLRTKPYDKTTQKLSLKEKLLSNMITKTDSSQTNENCIEKMAKEGKLNNATNDVLKHWLRERSIPYRVNDRKSVLINKITAHMQNTRPLGTDTSFKNV